MEPDTVVYAHACPLNWACTSKPTGRWTLCRGSFQIGGNERIPDLAFISAARIPPEGEPETKWPIPPDLAVEVMSPNDLYERVYAKLLEYLAAGVKQVWLVSPEHHTVTIYRSATNITAFAGD